MFMPILSSCIPEASLFPFLITKAFKFWRPDSDWILSAVICGLQTIKGKGSVDSLKKVGVGFLEGPFWWADWDSNVPTAIPVQSKGSAGIILADQCRLDLRLGPISFELVMFLSRGSS